MEAFPLREDSAHKMLTSHDASAVFRNLHVVWCPYKVTEARPGREGALPRAHVWEDHSGPWCQDHTEGKGGQRQGDRGRRCGRDQVRQSAACCQKCHGLWAWTAILCHGSGGSGSGLQTRGEEGVGEEREEELGIEGGDVGGRERGKGGLSCLFLLRALILPSVCHLPTTPSPSTLPRGCRGPCGFQISVGSSISRTRDQLGRGDNGMSWVTSSFWTGDLGFPGFACHSAALQLLFLGLMAPPNTSSPSGLPVPPFTAGICSRLPGRTPPFPDFAGWVTGLLPHGTGSGVPTYLETLSRPLAVMPHSAGTSPSIELVVGGRCHAGLSSPSCFPGRSLTSSLSCTEAFSAPPHARGRAVGRAQAGGAPPGLGLRGVRGAPGLPLLSHACEGGALNGAKETRSNQGESMQDLKRSQFTWT